MSRGQADGDNASVKIPLTILYHVHKPNPHSHVSHTPDFCPQCWESFFTLQSLRTQTVAVLTLCLACDIFLRSCVNFLPLLELRTINLVAYRNTDLPSQNSGGTLLSDTELRQDDPPVNRGTLAPCPFWPLLTPCVQVTSHKLQFKILFLYLKLKNPSESIQKRWRSLSSLLSTSTVRDTPLPLDYYRGFLFSCIFFLFVFSD